MEISGEDECLLFLKDCLKVFKPFRGAYIRINYSDLPRNVLGRVNADLQITKTSRARGLFRRRKATKISRKIVKKEFYIRISSIFLRVIDTDLREELVKSVIMHELLHIERGDLIESSKDYHRRKHKKLHSNLEKEALQKINALRLIKGLDALDSDDYLQKEIKRLISGY